MCIGRGSTTGIQESRGEDMPGSAAACSRGPAPPSSTPIVEAQHLNSSEFRSLHTAKSTQPPGSQNPRISPCRGRKEYSAVQRKTEGGCEPWPGQPGRSDPKQSIWSSGRGSLLYQFMEQADSRRRKDLWDYAPNYRQTDRGRRQDDVRKGSAQ